MNLLKLGRVGVVMLAVAMLAILGGCKSSGVAVSERGQIMNMDIDVPTDLSEGETKELTVSIANRGVNKIDDVIFEIEMPNELLVLGQNPSPGVRWTDRMSSWGTKIYQYQAGDIEVGTEAEVKFNVRAQFGSLQRTGDIKVTAWSEDLPGDKLLETKYIKLRS